MLIGWENGMFDFLRLRKEMKNAEKSQMKSYDCLDHLIVGLDTLVSVCGKKVGDHYETQQPYLVDFSNPTACFSLYRNNKEQVAKSVAEALYAFSGMNGSDFIWEFRGWDDPRKNKSLDLNAIGPSLRFF